MPIVEGAAKAVEATGKAAVATGKTLGAATNAAANAANAGANVASSASAGLSRAGAGGLGLQGNSGIGNSHSGLGNSGSLGNNSTELGSNRSGLGNNKPGLGNNKSGLGNGNHGLRNNKNGLGANQGINNRNKGLGANKGLGNDLGNLHKKGENQSLFNRKSPLGPRNYFQRVNQEKRKMEDRGEDATGILPYIKAIPLLTKIAIVSLVSFLTLIFFGVSIFASIGKQSNTDQSVSSGVIVGNVSMTFPVQISTLSPVVVSFIQSHVSDSYQNIAENIGHNQTATTIDGTPVSDEETLYYQKVADIAYRYKQLYDVELDWALLTTANLYVYSSTDNFYERNIGGYSSSDVADLEKTMPLDWDFDYMDIAGYNYLEYDNYIYDLPILAKNMVTKTTTQQCVSGNTVLETKEVYDVEDEYLNEEHPDYLVCKTGTYKVKSEYKLDKEKFDEFLLEYLDSRIYGINNATHGSGVHSTPVAPAPSSGQWGWPLPNGATTCRSSLYGYRIHPITGQPQFHSGDDYPAATGTPVYAIGDGTVIDVNTGCTVGNTNCGGGAGNYVKIDHGGGVVSIYMHASTVLVQKGQHVSRGTEIMKVGTTGSSTGPHLHITIRLNGQLTDPGNYIGSLPKCN